MSAELIEKLEADATELRKLFSDEVRGGPPLSALAVDALREAGERIARLESELNDALEFIEPYGDVLDGDYGEPRPNRAMVIASNILDALGHKP